MPKFRLTAVVTVSAYTIVEADTLEAAIEEAGARPVEIGGPNSGYSPREHWLIEEADGTPQNIQASDA